MLQARPHQLGAQQLLHVFFVFLLQALPFLRGANHSMERSSSSARGLLSIHPKHSAVATASSYAMRDLPVVSL